MDIDENTQKALAVALIAGANAIEKNQAISENFDYAGVSILYGEAAVMLREKAVELIYKSYLNESGGELHEA